MVRNPSLHITEQQLAVILKQLITSGEVSVNRYEDFAKQILHKAKGLALSGRSIQVTNDKLLRDTDRVKKSSRTDAAKFAHTLLMYRRKLKHRGITQINIDSPDWLLIKDLCNLANEFAAEFSLPREEAYQTYIELGFQKMVKFSLGKLKSLHSAIIESYESLHEIKTDRTPKLTKEAHDIYLSIISERTGFTSGFENMPEKYVYFVRVKNEALKLKISIKQYLTAQFTSFEWANKIPDPIQLVGIKAIQRVQKYCFEHKIKIGQQSADMDWSKIKKTKK